MSDKYKVWAFEKNRECYDCGQSEETKFNFPLAAKELTKEEFEAFQYAVKKYRSSWTDHVFLYLRPDSNPTEVIDRVVAEGREEKERLELKKLEEEQKRVQRDLKKAKSKELEAKKKADQERKLYAELKAKFEK